MNKPASELIALDKAGLDAAVRECARITAPEISDEEYERIVAEDSLRYRNTRLDMERTILAYLSAANQSGSERAGVDAPFQSRVHPWMMACFGPEISANRSERNHRFLEEAIELVQSLGCTQSEAHQLVDYVYGRPEGEPNQEVGGVMVTLAALCLANDLDMAAAGETELARIWTKVEKIRAKQAAKPKHSPLPEALTTPPAQPAPASDYDFETNDHGKPDGSVREALRNLLDYAEQRECSHEATHRGGSIWTICDECGKKWADDRGGFIPYQEPKEITQARAALHSPKIAAADDDVETCIACNIAFVEGDMVYPDASGGSIHASCCGPERESYANADGEPLKDGDPMPTPQRWTSAAAETSPGDVRTESSKQYRDAVDSVNRSTDREIADALAMKEALARAFCVAKGVNPNCLHQNYDDEPVDHTDAHGRTFHFGWRNQLHLVDAAMPFIDRLDVKAEAKSQEPEASWLDARKLINERLEDLSQANALYGKDNRLNAPEKIERNNREITWLKDLRSVLALTHPTTKPEAPAVSVEQLARTIATAKGVNPDCLHQNYGDEPVDHEDARGRTFHYGWRNQMHIAMPVAALIAGGR